MTTTNPTYSYHAPPSNIIITNNISPGGFAKPITQLPYNNSNNNTTTSGNGISMITTIPQSIPQPNVSKFNHEMTRKYSIPSSNNTTNPNKNKNLTKNPSSWDPMDDLLLRHLKEIQKMGWKEISQYFDNRTPNACQFRWRRLKSGNLKSNRTALIDVTEFPGKIEIKNRTTLNTTSSRKRNSSKTKKNKTASLKSVSNDDTKQINNTSNVNAPQNIQNILNGSTNDVTNSQQLPLSSSTSPKGSVSRVQIPSPQRSSSFQHSISTSINSSTNEVNAVRNGSIPIANGSTQCLPAGPVSSFVDKFAKPRSYSYTPLSLARPTSQAQALPLGVNNPTKQLPLPQPLASIQHQQTYVDKENIGFVPKVFVKSRRGSSIVPSPSQSVASSISHTDISGALNTTLNSSKSRKNSFTSWSSRRSSFNVSLSNGTTRRSSMIIPPNTASNVLGSSLSNQVAHLSKERRESLIKKEFVAHQQNRQSSYLESGSTNPNVIFTNQYTFSYIPPPPPVALQGTKVNGSLKHTPKNLEQVAQLRSISNLSNYSTLSSSSIEQPMGKKGLFSGWTIEEEQLLINSRAKNLSPVELSIVLPNRSKEEIEARLNGFSSDSISGPLSPRKPLSVNQLAMQNDEDEVDPLHSHNSIARPDSLSSSSSSSFVSKETSPVNSSTDDSTSTTPSSITSTSFGRGLNKPILNQKMTYKSGGNMNSLPPHSEGIVTGQNFTAGYQYPQRSGSNAQLPSISSIFKTMM